MFCIHVCHSTCMEARGQRVRMAPPLPCGFSDITQILPLGSHRSEPRKSSSLQSILWTCSCQPVYKNFDCIWLMQSNLFLCLYLSIVLLFLFSFWLRCMGVLCSWKWPWISDFPTPTSQVLEIQMFTTTTWLCVVPCWTHGIMNVKEAPLVESHTSPFGAFSYTFRCPVHSKKALTDEPLPLCSKNRGKVRSLRWDTGTKACAHTEE